MLSQLFVIVAIALVAAPEALAAGRVSRGQVDINALRARVRRQMEPGYRPARVKRQSSTAAATFIQCGTYSGQLDPAAGVTVPTAFSGPQSLFIGTESTTAANSNAGEWFFTQTAASGAANSQLATGFANLGLNGFYELNVTNPVAMPTASSTGSAAPPQAPSTTGATTTTSSASAKYLTLSANFINNGFPFQTQQSNVAMAFLFSLYNLNGNSGSGQYLQYGSQITEPVNVTTSGNTQPSPFYFNTPTTGTNAGRLFFEVPNNYAALRAGTATVPTFNSTNIHVVMYCTPPTTTT